MDPIVEVTTQNCPFAAHATSARNGFSPGNTWFKGIAVTNFRNRVIIMIAAFTHKTNNRAQGLQKTAGSSCPFKIGILKLYLSKRRVVSSNMQTLFNKYNSSNGLHGGSKQVRKQTPGPSSGFRKAQRL
jgi:hypothetical protein